MAGINLSSSVEEKKTEHSGLFDGSLVAITVIFFLVAASWGGMRWYISTLDDTLAGIDATFAESAPRLQGQKVDRVANFDARLGLVGRQLDGSKVDSEKLLVQLESLVIPNVKLTKYEYNQAERFVEVAGKTDNFKYIAQQIISLKSEDPFANIRVESIERTKEGGIVFALKAQL